MAGPCVHIYNHVSMCVGWLQLALVLVTQAIYTGSTTLSRPAPACRGLLHKALSQALLDIYEVLVYRTSKLDT